jgi:hypothetical protein
MVMSSRVWPRQNSSARCRQLIGETVLEVGHVRATGVGQAVGVKEQHIAGVQVDCLGGWHRIREDPERDTAAVQLLGPPVGPDQHRAGMAGAGEHHPQAAALPLGVTDSGGHEPPAEFLRQHDVVDAAQNGRRIGVPVRERPDRMPRGGGHRRRVFALATDVPDGDSPAPACRVDVIEVTTDLLLVARGHMCSGDLSARDLP